ncbi:hypothetical protein [Desertivirga brevis]|uniref:hypothetical protein n=1 Tax=Desertivirga brevis TaxID=2810310 RepID=UPI001A96BF14|nr:hypothetical protein [Pedobacter sp. SYSU D00873]
MNIKRLFNKKSLLVAGLVFFAFAGKSQSEFKVHESGEKGMHRFTFSLAELYFNEGKSNEIHSTFVPAYALNYDYMFNSRWSLGMHNDIPMHDIELEEQAGESKSAETERPVASKIIGTYHTHKHLGLLFGFGDEIAHHENFFITSAGAEYEFHLKGSWQLGAEIVYDHKFNTADTWMVGIGISKTLTRHHKG